MKRKLGDYFSLGAIRNVKYLPAIIARIYNWPQFLLTYLGFRGGPMTFFMRNGARIITGEAVDAVTLMVVFIRQEYGIVPDDAVVIDIGANIGVFAIYAAITAKNTSIYAFEPMEHTYNIMKHNILINRLEDRIHPFNIGVADHAGERRLYLGEGSPYHTLFSDDANGNSVAIDCTTLRDIFEQEGIEKCDLLKLDCEGAEFEILYNTPDDYLHRTKCIRLEYHNLDNDKNNVSELKRYLESKGFRETTPQRAVFGDCNNSWFERIV